MDRIVRSAFRWVTPAALLLGVCVSAQTEVDRTLFADGIAPLISQSFRAASYAATGQKDVIGPIGGSPGISLDKRPRTIIDDRTWDPVRRLVDALARSVDVAQVIELCNVDLDLTGYGVLTIGEDTWLRALPGCERGPRREGPRLRVRKPRRAIRCFSRFERAGCWCRVSGSKVQPAASAQAMAIWRSVSIFVRMKQ